MSILGLTFESRFISSRLSIASDSICVFETRAEGPLPAPWVTRAPVLRVFIVLCPVFPI